MSTDSKKEVLKAKEWLFRADHVCVLSHESPDGDAVGSALGISWALRSIGKKVTTSLSDDVPARFSFLPGSMDVKDFVPVDADMVVAVDAADWDRLGPIVNNLAAPIDINIDHHISNSKFAHINLVDTQASATAEYLTNLVKLFGLNIDDRVAQCLLTGIVTDTIGFRTTSTSTSTLLAAEELMHYDVNLHKISRQTLHCRSYEATKLWGYALSRVSFKDGLAWTEVTLADKLEAGYTAKGDADIVSQMTAIDGAEVSVVFVERRNSEIKISWRSVKGVDVAAIAKTFGGGGHQAAAGANMYGTDLERAKDIVLQRTREAMDNYQS
tara:strand:- start:476 stop:1453 length:978 start_codon:yes stop_codon:yes gene_type:complete